MLVYQRVGPFLVPRSPKGTWKLVRKSDKEKIRPREEPGGDGRVEVAPGTKPSKTGITWVALELPSGYDEKKVRHGKIHHAINR